MARVIPLPLSSLLFLISFRRRSGLPVEDPLEAVRRAFPGDDFAFRAVSRAFGRPDPPPEQRSRQQVPENRAPAVEPRPEGAPVISEKRVDRPEAENAGNSCAQQGASTSGGARIPCSTSENRVSSEAAKNNGGAQPAPADAGNGAACGWTRRYALVGLQRALHSRNSSVLLILEHVQFHFCIL